MVKKLIVISTLIVVAGIMVGCARDNLNAPCANYGQWCSKTPINSWNYNS